MRLGTLNLLFISTLQIFLSHCSTETRKIPARVNSADANKNTGVKPGDNHGNGQEPVILSPDTNKVNGMLATVLSLAPLPPNHMMTQLGLSNRPFVPSAGMGAWGRYGLQWQADLPVAIKAATALNFTLEPAIETECRVDNGEWSACTNSVDASTQVQGFHEAQVRSKTSKVVLGVFRWCFDTTPPKLFLARNGEGKKILIVSNEEIINLACTINGQNVDCKNGFESASFANASILAKAQDLAGNATEISIALGASGLGM